MQKVTCERCGLRFKVERIAAWKFARMCDNCLVAIQPPYTAKQRLIDRQDRQLEERENAKKERAKKL